MGLFSRKSDSDSNESDNGYTTVSIPSPLDRPDWADPANRIDPNVPTYAEKVWWDHRKVLDQEKRGYDANGNRL